MERVSSAKLRVCRKTVVHGSRRILVANSTSEGIASHVHRVGPPSILKPHSGANVVGLSRELDWPVPCAAKTDVVSMTGGAGEEQFEQLLNTLAQYEQHGLAFRTE